MYLIVLCNIYIISYESEIKKKRVPSVYIIRITLTLPEHLLQQRKTNIYKMFTSYITRVIRTLSTADLIKFEYAICKIVLILLRIVKKKKRYQFEKNCIHKYFGLFCSI